MASMCRLGAALFAMVSSLAEAGQAVSGHASQHGDAGTQVRQRKLVRSERPIWKMFPDRREEPFRFPDDDDSGDSSSDPYAADPSSAQHPQPTEPSAAHPEHANEVAQADASVSSDTEVRQQVSGSTPATYINIGTPEKKLFVILDTGSDKLVAKTWSTIQKELKTVDGGLDDAVMPSPTVYNRDTSSTYTRIYSNASAEASGQEELSTPAGVKDSKGAQKQGYIAYGSGVAITDEGQDTVKVGNRGLVQFPISEISQDSLSMLHTKQGIAGILGLQHMKNASMGESFFTRARSTGGMYSFSYCRGDNNDGTFIWGDKATDGHKVDVLGQIHWAVNLQKVKMVSSASRNPKPEAALDEVEAQHSQISRTQQEQSINPSFGSSLLHKGNPDGDTASGNALDDPELKEEIGKMVGDIIGKVIDKIEKKKGHVDEKENAGSEVSSNVFCGENEQCTAILDTGSNIIAGPSDGIKELVKFANVKPDCSNLDELPHLHISLNDFKADLPPKAYVMQVKLPKGAAGAEGLGDDPSGDPMGDMGDSGASGSGGGEGGMDGMDGMMGFSRHRSKKVRAWFNIVKRLYTSRGVDLSAAMRGIGIQDLLRRDQLCMPAFVPLDKKTAVGKLWVVGTPLFEQYYTRWSWGKEDKAPSVFLADKHVAKACAGTAAQNSGSSTGASSAVSAKESTGFFSHQQAGKPLEFLDKGMDAQTHAKRLPLLDVTDIRYPHWARALSDV